MLASSKPNADCDVNSGCCHRCGYLGVLNKSISTSQSETISIMRPHGDESKHDDDKIDHSYRVLPRHNPRVNTQERWPDKYQTMAGQSVRRLAKRNSYEMLANLR